MENTVNYLYAADKRRNKAGYSNHFYDMDESRTVDDVPSCFDLSQPVISASAGIATAGKSSILLFERR